MCPRTPQIQPLYFYQTTDTDGYMSQATISNFPDNWT